MQSNVIPPAGKLVTRVVRGTKTCDIFLLYKCQTATSTATKFCRIGLPNAYRVLGHSLIRAERDYCALFEKNVSSCDGSRTFHYYLCDRKFMVRTAKSRDGYKKCNSSQYDFEIISRPGSVLPCTLRR
jgi:hypothetical protein